MDNVESFREFLLGHFPTLKLPKGKKYVEFPIGKGMLVCCMVKTNGVNVYLYSGGRVPAREVFDKLNSLGISGKVIDDKYTITPMPGSRNPNVVRIDLLIPYDGRELNSTEMREEVLNVYIQLIDLCMPLNPDNPFYESNKEQGSVADKGVEESPVEKSEFYKMEDLESEVIDEEEYDEFLKLKGTSEPFSGFVKFFSNDGEELSVFEIKDGKMYDGTFYSFHKNGNPSEKIIYKEGKYIQTEEFGDDGKEILLKPPKMRNKTDFKIEFVEGGIHEAFYKVNGHDAVVYYSEGLDREYSPYDYPDGLSGVELSAFADVDADIEGLKFTILTILEVDVDGNGWDEWFNNFSAVEEPTVTFEGKEANVDEKTAVTNEENSNILNSVWEIRENTSDAKRLIFLENNKFKSFQTRKDGIKIPVNDKNEINDKNSWSIKGTDVEISFNDRFLIYSGKINSELNKMEGTYENEPGTKKGTWEATILQDISSTSKNDLEITIEGKFHYYKFGVISDEMKSALQHALEYIDNCDSIESLIENIWYGNTREIFSSVPENIKNEWKLLKTLENQSMGGVWQEFDVFYSPPIIDEDNVIKIMVDGKPIFEGIVKDLGNHLGSGFELEMASDLFRADYEFGGIELTTKIFHKIKNSFSMPYSWCEEIEESMESVEVFYDGLVDQGIKLTQKGWKMNNYVINNKKLETKASNVDLSNRMSVIEYGKFKIKSDSIEVNEFDSLGLIWWIDYDIMDMGGFNNLTQHKYDHEYKEDKIYSYKFSKVFYADEKDGISELDFTIHDFSILDVSCNDTWPTDE